MGHANISTQLLAEITEVRPTYRSLLLYVACLARVANKLQYWIF